MADMKPEKGETIFKQNSPAFLYINIPGCFLLLFFNENVNLSPLL